MCLISTQFADIFVGTTTTIGFRLVWIVMGWGAVYAQNITPFTTLHHGAQQSVTYIFSKETCFVAVSYTIVINVDLPIFFSDVIIEILFLARVTSDWRWWPGCEFKNLSIWIMFHSICHVMLRLWYWFLTGAEVLRNSPETMKTCNWLDFICSNFCSTNYCWILWLFLTEKLFVL